MTSAKIVKAMKNISRSAIAGKFPHEQGQAEKNHVQQ
jgi:hypothetical protein